MINTPIGLASASPRRLELLKSLDLTVRVIPMRHQEIIDPSWRQEDIPLHLATQKNNHANALRQPDEILLTADTIVLIDGEILHKPVNYEAARGCLEKLSNTCHRVITGVCLSANHQISFSTVTKVWMNKISPEAIDYYINHYHPLDKAGAYGIQEWIGWSHVKRIEGSYSNVMGLPTSEVYQKLTKLSKG